jgi:transcriptional regulator with GAF, ATPase, and Fis domain
MWFRCHNENQAFAIGRVIDPLRRAGIELTIASPAPPSGSGLFVFSEVNQQTCEALARDSQQGFNRVLAVALNGSALTDGAVWKILHHGAADVYAWDALEDPAAIIGARFERYAEIDELLSSPAVRQNLAGGSRAWISLLRQVVEVARYSQNSVLLVGESGTGKELIARLIHALDPRPNKSAFVVLDCTTVSPELSGSEFFGHERGAFTSAIAARDGAFSLADGGTLFLDEVGELPLTLQAELLRVVQERTYKRVGSNTWKQANFRLICATNRNLLAEEARGRFRRDFYFRIAHWTCKLPSLQERREDILPLVTYFLRQICAGGSMPELDSAVRDYLLSREYPGNIRELKHLVARLATRHVGHGPITVGDIPEDERQGAIEFMQQVWRNDAFKCAIRRALALGLGLKEISGQTAELAIQTALEDEAGNLQRAARRLGVTDRALQMRRAAARPEMTRPDPPADEAVKTPELPRSATDRRRAPPLDRGPRPPGPAAASRLPGRSAAKDSD